MERPGVWRGRIAAGEAREVKAEVLAALEELTGSDRARAYGLLVACCRDLDETEEGLDFLAKGEALGVRETRARVELLAQGASLLIRLGEVGRARDYLGRSLDIVETELAKPEGTSGWSRRRRAWFVRAKARNLVLRGDLTHRFKDRPEREALRDAFEAIEVAKGFPREQVCGVSLVCSVLTLCGGLAEVVSVLKLTEKLDVYLSGKRVPRNHPYKLRVRWARAVALARLGMDERAESLMREVADELIRKGMTRDARLAVETLLWMIGERSGEIGRARFVAAKYREAIPELEVPKLPEPVRKDAVRGW
jgi:hypothetical protein